MKDEDKCLDCEHCYIDNLFYEVMCKLNKCEFKEEKNHGQNSPRKN